MNLYSKFWNYEKRAELERLCKEGYRPRALADMMGCSHPILREELRRGLTEKEYEDRKYTLYSKDKAHEVAMRSTLGEAYYEKLEKMVIKDEKKRFLWFACDSDFINSQQMDEIASMPNRIGHSIIYLYLQLISLTLEEWSADINRGGYARLNIEPNPTALINFIKKRTGIAEEIIAIGLEELIRRELIEISFDERVKEIEMYLPEVAKRQ